MSRAIHRLSARAVETLKVPGRHADGGGLYLHITEFAAASGRRWIFRFTSPATRRVREMGLGSAAKGGVTLAAARTLASEARTAVQSGHDPIELRKANAGTAIAIPTFGRWADDYIAAMEPSWRNEKHVAQWKMTLTTYAAPLRNRRVDAITTEHVLEVLKPLWTSRPETANRLRGRIEAVLDAATAKGLRTGDNPARWRGHLSTLLPSRQKLTRGHHKALPYADLPTFMDALRASEGTAARLLEFTILTAARSGEAIGTRWCEIDLKGVTWTIPADRMKAGREHRVPLSDRAVEVLGAMTGLSDEFVFPGMKAGSPLSNMAMTSLLWRMGYGHVTVHGFRSAFSDWCSERTAFSSEVREMALAHTIPNKAEAAYRRGDLFDKRRQLMAAWAEWCEPPTRTVVALRTDR